MRHAIPARLAFAAAILTVTAAMRGMPTPPRPEPVASLSPSIFPRPGAAPELQQVWGHQFCGPKGHVIHAVFTFYADNPGRDDAAIIRHALGEREPALRQLAIQFHDATEKPDFRALVNIDDALSALLRDAGREVAGATGRPANIRYRAGTSDTGTRCIPAARP